MNRTKQKRVSERDALAALLAAHRRYGMEQFRLADLPPSHRPALDECRRRDWLWFSTPAHARITRGGLEALEPYGVREKVAGAC